MLGFILEGVIKSPRSASVSARKLKLGVKTPYAMLVNKARRNLGLLPVWTGNGPKSRLISRKIVQI